MKKILMLGSILLVLGLLVVASTTTIFAHSPDNGETSATDGEAWEAMHEACENGDWEAMSELAEEVHGTGGHMDGGHMGGGMMGSGMTGGW